MYARRDQFLVAQLGWMMAALFLFVVLGLFSYELFFISSLLGLLVMIRLTVPFRVTPAWQRRLRWVILIGIAGFGYIIARRLLELLPPGVF